MGLGVATLALASLWNNYQHVQNLGPGIVGLVVAAELLKPLLPLALISHANNRHAGAWVATLGMWGLIVCFSFLNTFGNALTQHATEQARLERAKVSETRPEHLILKDIGQLPACPKKGCTQQVQDRRKALEAEHRAALKRVGTREEVVAKGEPVRDGILTLTAWAGIELHPERVFVLVTLIWTLLAEVGSALGALAIPRRDTK